MTGRKLVGATIDRSGCKAKRHGRPADYTYRKCRCPDTREAWRLYSKRLREGRNVPQRVDSTGTARRLQSLVTAGHCQRALSAHLGFHRDRVSNLIRQVNPSVTRHTADLVRDLFRRLDGTRGTSKHALACARRNGWVDAAAWDDIDDPTERPKVGDAKARIVDEVAIARALGGDRVHLSRAEVAEGVTIGRARGLSADEIGQRLQVTSRTVQRIGARVRVAA